MAFFDNKVFINRVYVTIIIFYLNNIGNRRDYLYIAFKFPQYFDLSSQAKDFEKLKFHKMINDPSKTNFVKSIELHV